MTFSSLAGRTVVVTGAARGQGRALALLLESARHNLGAPRTINLPSLPLGYALPSE